MALWHGRTFAGLLQLHSNFSYITVTCERDDDLNLLKGLGLLTCLFYCKGPLPEYPSHVGSGRAGGLDGRFVGGLTLTSVFPYECIRFRGGVPLLGAPLKVDK